MTGPEHYQKAERLAGEAEVVMDADYGWMEGLSSEERLQWRTAYLTDAQVHATLALAAATAFCGGSQLDSQGAAWAEVCGGAA